MRFLQVHTTLFCYRYYLHVLVHSLSEGWNQHWLDAFPTKKIKTAILPSLLDLNSHSTENRTSNNNVGVFFKSSFKLNDLKISLQRENYIDKVHAQACRGLDTYWDICVILFIAKFVLFNVHICMFASEWDHNIGKLEIK